MRSPRACGSAICSGRCGDFDDSREGGRANWCRSAWEAELVGFGTVIDGSVLSTEALEEMAVVDFVAARVVGYGRISTLVNACLATDTAGGLASSVRRLRGRDLRGLGDFCAGATVVDYEAEATLVFDAICAGREGVVGRGFSNCSGVTPALSGC